MGLGIVPQSSPITQGLMDHGPQYTAQKYPSAFALKLWFPANDCTQYTQWSWKKKHSSTLRADFG